MEADSAHIAQDQREVAAFLSQPEAYDADGPVERIDTHAAMVFLVGKLAYKVKRAVKFPYMDFSTLRRRHMFCLREVELNRRTAPNLYRGVVPITRHSSGRLAVDGPGAVVEWAVVMRRFDQDGLFDHLAETQALTEDICRGAADAIASFHSLAERLSGKAAAGGGYAGMQWVIDDNVDEIRERPDLFPLAALDAFADASQQRLADCREILDQRLARGLVRRCHGDLHLRNICMIDGTPTIFDGIEFDDRLSCIDVMYDLAFLLMDLERRDLRACGNIVLNRYLRCSEDLDGLAALPLFLSARAGVRAKVAASAAASQRDRAARAKTQAEAAGYFRLARTLLEPGPPRLIALGGLSGTGKTSLARRIAPLVGTAPGALLLRSDVIRKKLAGVGELTRLPRAAYSAAMTEEVYAVLSARAAETLAAGHGVVVDAAHLKPSERAQIEQVARIQDVPFDGIWLEASLDTTLNRVAGRARDASDATGEIVRMQTGFRIGDVSWSRVNAEGPPDVLVSRMFERLRMYGPQ